MSFLSGILSIGKTAVSFLSGNSIGSSLVKTALLGLAVNKLSKNANKGNDSGTQNIDNGVRLQAKPNAAAKIPVLYGSAFFGGNISDAAMTNANKTMWYCLVLSEKTGTVYSTSTASAYTLDNVYWNNQRIVFNSDGITANYTVDSSGTIDRSISGLVKVYFYAGGRTSGQVPTGYTGTVPNAETLFPNWTSGTHAMSNLIFALVRVDYNREKNVTGIGDMLFNITNSMKSPGDVVYDYLTNTRYGAGISSSNILTTDIAALNTYSQQAVAYDDQGTGAETLDDRYQINGLIDTENPVLENAEAILSACGSWLSYDTHVGKWGVVINKADTSVASFNDSNILGNISLSGTGLQDLYNQVKVEFPHRELRDSADFYNIEIPESSIPADWADFSRNANEEDNVLNITYDIINEPIQAQMLGLIELKQSRLDKVIQFQTDFSYYNLKAGDIIDVTNARFEFTNKLFRIVTITEIQDDGGALMMSITALEYNVNVYSVADLYRFTRSDDNGIITIGSIGQPGTPTVSKIERDARPRVEITSSAPTGVVEGMEFWLTTDVGIPDDANRSYTLVGIKRPVGGGVYTSGTNVTLEYVTSASDFYVKTRGFNATTVGQYSAVSGLVEFAPEQLTDAIGPDTSMYDSTGGLLGALALVELLGKVSDLFGDDTGKSLFDKIFSVFQDETGVDLVGQASGGDLVVAADLETKADGTSLGVTTSSYDFVGPIEATGSGDITVKLTDGINNKDVLAWDAENGIWRTISDCIQCDFPVIPEPPAPATPCSLTVNSTLPANNYSLGTLCHNDTTVPFTGSYFIKFDVDPGTQLGGTANPDIPLLQSIQPGLGNVYLYGTDGKLEQTLTESQILIHNDVVELPFAPRQPGKDYYILIDDGLLTYCDCENVAINTAETWTFRTSLVPREAYKIPTPTTIAQPSNVDYNSPPVTINFTASPTGAVCSLNTDIVLTFSSPVKKGTGSILVKNASNGSSVASLSVSGATITDIYDDVDDYLRTEVNFGSASLSQETSYNVLAPRGLLLLNTDATSSTTCGVTTTIPAGPNSPSAEKTWGIRTEQGIAVSRVDYCPTSSGNADAITNIKVTFNKTIAAKASGAAPVQIYSADGSLHQEIDLNGTFADDKYGNISSISGNTLTLNPTAPFKGATDYYLIIPSGTLVDPSCNIAFSGITDTNTIAWRTDGIETTPPDGPIYGSLYIDIEFDRPVVPGYGKINAITTDGVLVTQVSSRDWTVRYQDNVPFE